MPEPRNLSYSRSVSIQSKSGWFDRGAEAFRLAQPNASTLVPWAAFYVCPICLVAYPKQALADGRLTREHVPPRSVGGRRMVLTCKACNDIAGHSVDAHADREATLHRFARGETVNRRAYLSTSSGSIPIRLSSSTAGILAAGVPNATDPATHAAVMADFDRVAREGTWQDFRFNIGFEAFDQSLVRLSWLRAAYLAWFAALGYRFILRSEMAPIRAKIRHFDSTAAPLRFRMLMRNQTLRPQLVIVDEPRELRCFAMLYEFNAVLFPRIGDSELYERLAERPDAFSENLSGFEVPWPSGPTFAWDLIK